MKSKIISYIFIILFLISNAIAVCTVTLDDTTYRPSETATATIVCSGNEERNQAYTLTWRNSTTVIETDTGTTPNTVNEAFFETLLIPGDANWNNGNVTLTGTQLEGFDNFNVSGNASNLLTVNDAKFSSNALLGNLFAVDYVVKDVDGNEISNAHCFVYATDENEAPLQECGEQHTHDGRGVCSGILDADAFFEGNNYLAKIKCNCDYGSDSCFDEEGTQIEGYHGSTSFPFTVSKWLNVTTITDKSAYTLDDEVIYVCANISNNQNYRIPLEITYNYRCGSPDSATDRVVIDSFTEIRGISAYAIQNQCADLDIRNVPAIQNQVESCYGATDVKILRNDGTTKFTYPTTSAMFTITSDSDYLTLEGDNMISVAFYVFIIIAFYVTAAATWNFKLFTGQNDEKNTVMKALLLWVGFFLMNLLAQIARVTAEINALGNDVLSLLDALYSTSIWITIVVSVYLGIYFVYNAILFMAKQFGGRT